MPQKFNKITSRQVIGWFYEALDTAVDATWLDQVSSYFRSDQKSEEYPWLGQVPKMRLAVGGRQATGLSDRITSYNVCYTKLLRTAVSRAS